jgi:ABC-2 type transport system ATP-binding protein
MIKIDNLSFSYEKKPLFNGFNLEIPKNQTLLITGINGVGKSTLLRLIAGVLLPKDGKITYDDKLIEGNKKKIGFISDSMSLYNDMKVSELIHLHKDIFKINEFYDSLIKHTKIPYSQKIGKLSVGQRVLLHLSLILSQNPDIILIDEVLPSIDAYLRDLFLNELIKVISERETTVIMVNLNFYDIENIIDRVILLKNGLIAVDEPIDILKSKVKKIICNTPPRKSTCNFQSKIRK